MDREDRRELYNGFGDAMARGIEFVGTPVLFGLIGFALDERLGVTPALTISLVLFGVAGVVVRAYYAYSAAMTRHEASGPWARRAVEPVPAVPADGAADPGAVPCNAQPEGQRWSA